MEKYIGEIERQSVWRQCMSGGDHKKTHKKKECGFLMERVVKKVFESV